jgi:hypothetical protein
MHSQPTVVRRGLLQALIGLTGLAASLSASAAVGLDDLSGDVRGGRVLEVATFAQGEVDVVVFSGGLREGWREGMRAEVLRGNLAIAELTVLHCGDRVSAASIESLASDVRIGAGDPVLVKLQKILN